MRRHLRWFVAAVVLAAGLPVGLLALVPQDLGFVSPDLFYEVSVDAGEQFFPAVDGNLAVYEDATGSGWRIGYYDFVTGNRGVVPQPSSGASDYWTNPSNGRIVFAREELGPTTVGYSILVYDTNTGVLTEVRRLEWPYTNQAGVVGQPALGGNTVAFVEANYAAFPPGEMFVARLDDPGAGAIRLTYDTDADRRIELSPSVSPSGDVIVWVSCREDSLSSCNIERATLSGGVWTVSRIATVRHPEDWARTDGQWIVYPKAGSTDPASTDICWQPIAGGTEQCLEMTLRQRTQRYPAIAGGVIVFNGIRPGELTGDIHAYQISTNRLFQITSTPANELLSGVAVLPDGRVRIVWDSGADEARNVYGADFTLPRVNTFTFGGFVQPVDSYPAFNVMKAGAAVPLRFSLGGFHGLDIFAADFPKSAPTTCGSLWLEAPVDETVTAGSSSLSYEPSTDLYTYVWKTDRAWAGSCRQVSIRLTDQSTQYANFKFK